MDLKTYQDLSARTESPNFDVGNLNISTLHGIVGISTEAGELLDAAKKAMFYGRDADKENIREEIGDLMWYIMCIIRSEEWDLEDIMQENSDKLKWRYPEQFTTKHSEIRLDKS